MRVQILATLTLSMALLVGCGGGGGGSTTAAAPTPVTAAPLAATPSSQLASSVSVSGYSALSIAAKTSSSVQTAGIKGMFQNLLARLISPAYAANTCGTDAYKLVGVNADGTSTPIQVTSGADQCGVGFRSMFDAGNYILLTGDSIYKDDLTCNLVFLNKSSGELFCVGETVPAKYDILGQTSWKNYARLQLSADRNYLFLEAAAVIFDSNNQITGKKTKIMRFGLSDTTKGPQGTILVEGFQNSWLSTGFTGDNSQFEGFDVQTYAGLDNGDAMIIYNRYVYNTGGMGTPASGSLSRHNTFYYRFASDSTYTRLEVDLDKATTLVQAELNTNTGGGSGNNTYTAANIYNIPCYFKSSSNKDKFFFAIPYYYWDQTGTGQGYQKSLIVSAVRPSATATKLDVNRYTTTRLCGNSWGQTASFQVINDAYYALDTNWVWNPNTNNGGQVTTLIKKDFGFANETPLDDVLYTVSSGTSWNNGKQFFVSKDYMYIKSPPTDWSMLATPGDTLDRYDPTTFNNTRAIGSQLGTALPVLESSRNISIQSIASTAADNLLKVVGRKTDDPDLVKIYGTISELGAVTWAPPQSTAYSPVTIVKL